MNPLIVYQTRTGNTRIIADAMASVMKADVVSVDDAIPDHFKERSLVGFGSGIYWTQLDNKIHAAISLLPANCKAFIFFTSGMGLGFMVRLYWYFVARRLARKGVKLVAQWDCRGQDRHPLFKWMGLSKGRPSTADLDSARAFALEVKSFAQST